ncbi:MAG: methylaspartate mutase subunit E, partial [Gammaproteobacteria bacterium]|nr:methylaspartate mutase subunit E [Gammaproteobacteria bacterium]
MELKEDKLKLDDFSSERDAVLKSWPTGEDVDFNEGVKFQQSLPESKRFSTALIDADKKGKTLLQPRAGVALLDDQVELLTYLEDSCDLLPTTIDAYTRLNRYDEAAVGIDKSNLAGTSLLNGFP